MRLRFLRNVLNKYAANQETGGNIFSQSGNRRPYLKPIRKQEAIFAANQETGAISAANLETGDDICSQSGYRRRYLKPIIGNRRY